MQQTKQIRKISKILSLLLRHKPEAANLELDENGWADVTVLIEKFSNKFFPLNVETLEIVARNQK